MSKVLVKTDITKKFLGAVLLIAGVSIGSGMLGMPIATGFAGFVPSLFVMAITWASLLFTGFLMVDVNIQHPGNIVTMAKNTLGSTGRIFSWITFLFLLYALDVAFLAAGGKILGALFPKIPHSLFPFLIAAPLAIVLSLGIHATDWVNRILVVGKLLVGYGVLVFLVPSHVEMALLKHVDLYIIPFTLPVIVQAFGFHTVIPSIVNYLDRDVSKIRLSLLLGNLIGFLVYLFWEFLVLGVVPVTGPASIASAYSAGDVATTPLIQILHSPLISMGATIFALCGMGTAYLGVTLGLMGFLTDGLKVSDHPSRKWISQLLTFAPPLVFVFVAPTVFLSALSYAGALVAIIFGLFPIFMAWKLPETSYWKGGVGKYLLLGASLFFLVTIVFDLLSQCGVFIEPIQKYLG